jgi:predicted membrane protein
MGEFRNNRDGPILRLPALWAEGSTIAVIHGIGWRVQADMLQTRFFSSTQNNFRLSPGIVLHF